MVLVLLLIVFFVMFLFFFFVPLNSLFSLNITNSIFYTVGMVMSRLEFLFLVMLFIVFSKIVFFSIYYLSKNLTIRYYLMLMFLFTMSMVIFIVSSSFFLVLMSWDLLGVTSFLLVNYYLSWESVNSAMITVMSNRVGDYFLMLAVFVWVPLYAVIPSIMPFEGMGISFVMAALTKSAQYPFSGWLPKAMAAPTPTSALVHSSTLVTAGILLVVKMHLLVLTVSSLIVVLWLGLLTMFVAGISALVEFDVKKLVALSTLSQMGLSMATVGCGLPHLGVLHLISHGFIKSLLFLQIGYLMHKLRGGQDSRGWIGGKESSGLVLTSMKISLLSLMGQGYKNGAITKEALIEGTLAGSSYFSVSFYLLDLSLTGFYSWRLWLSMFGNSFCSSRLWQLNLIFSFPIFVLKLMAVGTMFWVGENLMVLPIFIFNCESAIPFVILFVLISMLDFWCNYRSTLFTSKFGGEAIILRMRRLFLCLNFFEGVNYSALMKLYYFLKVISLLIARYTMSKGFMISFFITLLIMFK